MDHLTRVRIFCTHFGVILKQIKKIPLYFYGQYETEPYLFSTRSSSVENGGYAIALCRNDSNIISYSSKSLEFEEAQEFCRSRAVNDYKLGQFVGDKCAILVIDEKVTKLIKLPSPLSH